VLKYLIAEKLPGWTTQKTG